MNSHFAAARQLESDWKNKVLRERVQELLLEVEKELAATKINQIHKFDKYHVPITILELSQRRLQEALDYKPSLMERIMWWFPFETKTP
jgi:hypothetical protein